MRDIHVVPMPAWIAPFLRKGGLGGARWFLMARGHVLQTSNRQAPLIRWGRDLARAHKCELVIHARSARFRAKDTGKGAKDSRRRRG